MKYVVEWPNATNHDEASLARNLQVLAKQAPSENSTYLQLVERVDGRGGFGVVETDDPATIARAAAIFAPWLDVMIYPVLDLTDSAPILSEAVEFEAAVT